jgi:hypothetical protein
MISNCEYCGSPVNEPDEPLPPDPSRSDPPACQSCADRMIPRINAGDTSAIREALTVRRTWLAREYGEKASQNLAAVGACLAQLA